MTLGKLTWLLAVVTCFSALASASANRHLLQTSGNLPTFTGLPLTVTNANDPSATQTTQTSQRPVTNTPAGATTPATVQNPVTGALTPAPTAVNPILPNQAARTPAQVPANAPTALPPNSNSLAPQPSAQSAANVPAPAENPVVTAPTPAPSTTTVQAPTPAPTVSVVNAPVPAPQVEVQVPVPAPVPAPAPDQILQCGVKPECRLFVEDMLCCESAGVVNNKQHLVARLQCTHPVNYYPKCMNVSGPTNLTAFSQFESAAWSASHAVQVNFLEDFIGNATIEIEGPRTNANLSADCGLYITPCMFNGSMVTQVAPVSGLSFTTLETNDFLEVSSSIDDDVTNLDSLVMPNVLFPTACQQQNMDELDASFFAKDWASYSSGFQNTCNYTAFVDALAAAPSPQAVESGSVSTSSLN